MTMQADRPRRPPRPPVLDDEDRPGPPPLLSEEPKSDSRALTVFIALFALLAFGGIVWFAYDQGRQAVTAQTAPLIKADTSPTKVRPSEPGGLEVPHRDKLVFGGVDGNADTNGENGVERLLPPPEPPLTPPSPPAASESAPSSDTAAIPPARVAPLPPPNVPIPNAAPATRVEAAPIQDDSVPASRPGDAPVSGAASASATPAAPQPAPQPSPRPAPATSASSTPTSTTASVEPKGQAADSNAPPPTPTPRTQALSVAAAPAQTPASAAAATTSGPFRVQIGALRGEDEAKAEWRRVQGRYSDILGGLEFFVERVEVTGKGVFWRAQGGSMSERDARSACERLSAAGQPCIVVRR